MRNRVLAAASAAGRSERDVRCVLNLKVHLGDDRTPDAGSVFGDGKQVAGRLEQFVEMGFGGFNLVPEGDDLDAQVQELGNFVLPKVRAFARRFRRST